MSACRVLLADDHRILREGLRAMLTSSAGISVVGEAEDGRQAVERARELKPDVVVMDIGMAGLNGFEATRQIRADLPGTHVLALSTHSHRRYVLAMLEAGASGYVLKSAASEELLHAIAAVRQGRTWLGPDVADAVVSSYVARQFPTEESAHTRLGPREREVIQLLAEGRSSKEIAWELGISVRTVEAHRRNIMQKLDIHSVAELTKYAIREGLTSLGE